MSLIPAISPIHDIALAAELDACINNKTKPPGSLGRLETLGKQLGLIQRSAKPVLQDPAIIVFAADHGVCEENISAYPQSVTWQMVENFLAGGAAINVFARQNGIHLRIVDAGVKHDFGSRAGLLDRKIAQGSRNFAQEAAMSMAQCQAALEQGAALAAGLPGNVLGFGEMGIGNTTVAAALVHMLAGIPAADCVGAGTGLPPEGIAHKQAVIERAARLHAGASGALEVLAAVGGFEIAMMAGAMLGAAAQRKVLLIDGFIVSSALLVASRLQPAVLDYCVFAHRSHENGHARLLQALQAQPLLQLDMRLGEGTGAALAYPLLLAAVNFMSQMATFESAQVSGKSAD
jgi:nicotinate-nucleotide--dimethylbenzimidazole phosphoribosyltransferase